MSQPYKYFAFISYSRKDSKVAAWLQKRLEWFRFPVKLVPEDRRPPHPRYIQPIYRDKTNLPVTVESYWKDIRLALEASRFLIVLCSPHSAASKPVDKEVSHFLASHNNDTSLLVPIIIRGNVTSSGEDAAFCPTLRSLGEPLIERTLPTMLPDGDRDELDAWEQGFVSLVSYLLSLDRVAIGDHIQRESKRQAKVLRRWLGTVIFLTLCAVAFGIYSIVQKREADAQRNRAEDLLWTASRSDHEAAIKAVHENRHAEGLAYFERALRFRADNTAALASSAVHAFGSSAPAWRTRMVTAFEKGVLQLAFSHDGHRLAIVCKDNTARVIAVASGVQIGTPEFGGQVNSVSFSPDGRYLALGSGTLGKSKGAAQVIEMSSGKLITKTEFADFVSSVNFSSDGRYIAVGSFDATARVIEVASGREISKTEFGGEVTSVSFSADGLFVVAGSTDATAQVIEVASGRQVRKTEFGSAVNSVSFSPDGRYLAAGAGATAHVIEVASGREIHKTDFGGLVWSVSFSPDGRYFTAGSWDNTARVIEVTSGKEINKTEFANAVTSVSFSPDGRYLAAGSLDKIVRVMEVTSGRHVGKAEFGGTVTSVGFSPDGNYLATGSEDATARVIEVASGKEISITKFGGGVICMCFGSGGHYFAAGSLDKTARVIEVASGREISRTEFGGMVTTVSFSPDGRYLAAGSDDKTARVIDIASGKQISRTEFGVGVTAVSFSPNGHYLAVGSWDYTARVMEVVSGNQISKTKFGGNVNSLSFSSDGFYLAAGSLDDTVRVIEVASGKEISKTEIGGSVRCVCFSPDDRHLVAGCTDNTARVIEAASGKQIGKIEFGLQVTSVSFSPDGRYLGAASDDKTARIFDWAWVRAGDKSTKPVWELALRVQSAHRFQSNAQMKLELPAELASNQITIDAFIAAAPNDDERWQHSILKWSRMLPEERTTSPWTTESLRDAAGRWFIRARTMESIVDIANEAPWHPLEPVSLARAEKSAQSSVRAKSEDTDPAQENVRPAFLARLTLKRLHGADERLYGRETLAVYAAWSAMIMHGELHLDAEALKSLAFALERTPADKQKDLLELKAKLEAK